MLLRFSSILLVNSRRERGEQLCPFCMKTLYLTWMIYCFDLRSCCLFIAILKSRRGCDKWNILLDANRLFVQSLGISTQSQKQLRNSTVHNIYYKYKVFGRFFSFKLQIWLVLVNYGLYIIPWIQSKVSLFPNFIHFIN